MDVNQQQTKTGLSAAQLNKLLLGISDDLMPELKSDVLLSQAADTFQGHLMRSHSLSGPAQRRPPATGVTSMDDMVRQRSMSTIGFASKSLNSSLLNALQQAQAQAQAEAGSASVPQESPVFYTHATAAATVAGHETRVNVSTEQQAIVFCGQSEFQSGGDDVSQWTQLGSTQCSLDPDLSHVPGHEPGLPEYSRQPRRAVQLVHAHSEHLPGFLGRGQPRATHGHSGQRDGAGKHLQSTGHTSPVASG